MHIYQRYIAKDLLILFGVITLVLAGVVLLMQSLRFIDLIVNRGLSITTFIYFSTLLLPSLLMVIIPVSLFVATIMTYNKLISDSELVVLNSAGLSKFDLSKPALLVASLVTLICFSISLYFQPVSYQKFKDLQSFIRNNYASVLLQEEVFSNPVKGVTVYVESREKGGLLSGILVHDSRSEESAVTYIAKKGILQKGESGPQILLMDADAQKVNSKNNSLEVLYFDQYPLNLSMYIDEEVERARELEEMFINELLFFSDDKKPNIKSKFLAEGNHRLIWPLYSITLTLVALAGLLFGQFNRRGNWKKNVVISLVGLFTLGIALAFKSIASSNISLIFIMYFPFIIATGGALYFIINYRYPNFMDYQIIRKILSVYAIIMKR